MQNPNTQLLHYINLLTYLLPAIQFHFFFHSAAKQLFGGNSFTRTVLVIVLAARRHRPDWHRSVSQQHWHNPHAQITAKDNCPFVIMLFTVSAGH